MMRRRKRLARGEVDLSRLARSATLKVDAILAALDRELKQKKPGQARRLPRRLASWRPIFTGKEGDAGQGMLRSALRWLRTRRARWANTPTLEPGKPEEFAPGTSKTSEHARTAQSPRPQDAMACLDPCPLKLSEEEERLATMLECLHQLDEEVRQVFVMRCIWKLDEAYIAERLRIRRQVVEQHVVRAITLLGIERQRR